MGFIYCVTNILNGKRYVGQTTTTIAERWRCHVDHTRADVKRLPCPALYKAMRKHGVEHFVIECLEECDVASLDERERFWIEKLDTFGENGYNLTVGGESSAGCLRLPLSEEARRKISVGNRGKRRSIEARERYSQSKLGDKNPMYGKPSPKRTKIYQYKLTGEFVREYQSILQAAEENGYHRGNIRACCDGKYKQSQGYIWSRIRKEDCS